MGQTFPGPEAMYPTASGRGSQCCGRAKQGHTHAKCHGKCEKNNKTKQKKSLLYFLPHIGWQCGRTFGAYQTQYVVGGERFTMTWWTNVLDFLAFQMACALFRICKREAGCASQPQSDSLKVCQGPSGPLLQCSAGKQRREFSRSVFM